MMGLGVNGKVLLGKKPAGSLALIEWALVS